MRKNAIQIQKLTPEEKQMTKTIAVMNNKGGCGKTSTVLAIGLYIVRAKGKNVLFIDVDPSSNLSQRLGVEENANITDRLDSFFREAGIDSREIAMIPKYHNIRIISKDIKLGNIGILAGSRSSESEANHLENSFTGQTARNTKIRTGYSSIFDFYSSKVNYYKQYFNYIIQDTAPSIEGNQLNKLALQTADEIIIPIDGVEAAWGVRNLLGWMDNETRNLAKRPNGLFVMTKYSTDTKAVDSALNTVDKRSRNTVFSIMQKYFPEFVCDNGVRELKSIRHSIPGFGSKTEYNVLAEEILNKISQPRNNILDLVKQDALMDAYELELSKIQLKSRTRKPIFKKPYFEQDGVEE